jgi:hypothetical protein
MPIVNFVAEDIGLHKVAVLLTFLRIRIAQAAASAALNADKLASCIWYYVLVGQKKRRTVRCASGSLFFARSGSPCSRRAANPAD